MTTLDRIQTRQHTIKLGAAARTLYALPFYALGWLAGVVWWTLRFWWSSLATGFDDAND